MLIDSTKSSSACSASRQPLAVCGDGAPNTRERPSTQRVPTIPGEPIAPGAQILRIQCAPGGSAADRPEFTRAHGVHGCLLPDNEAVNAVQRGDPDRVRSAAEHQGVAAPVQRSPEPGDRCSSQVTPDGCRRLMSWLMA